MESSFGTLRVLMDRVRADGSITIQNENGNLSNAGFIFHTGCSANTLSQLQMTVPSELPRDYLKFLEITDGAELFLDIEYGQWGCKIYSKDEVLQKLPFDNSTLFPFAEWKGDGDRLFFDLQKFSNEGKNFIVDADEGLTQEKWAFIRGTFEQWIDRLIVSQGSKYWRW